MNCPVCGEVIQKGKSVCLRCGYAFKSLVLHAENEQDKHDNPNANEDEVKEIHPDDVHFGHSGGRGFGGGSIFDSLFGGGSIFDGFFGGGTGGLSDMIDDIFGGLFGGGGFSSVFSVGEDEEEQLYDEFGRPIGIDAFDKSNCIEIKDVECYDEHGNLKEKKKKSKNPFNRFKKPDDDKK